MAGENEYVSDGLDRGASPDVRGRDRAGQGL